MKIYRLYYRDFTSGGTYKIENNIAYYKSLNRLL